MLMPHCLSPSARCKRKVSPAHATPVQTVEPPQGTTRLRPVEIHATFAPSPHMLPPSRCPSRRVFFSLLALCLVTPGFAADSTPQSEAERLKRWQPKIDRYLERDKTNPPPVGGVVFAGSSSIEMWSSLAADFPEFKPVNRGIGGTWLGDLPLISETLAMPLKPEIYVVYAGENDLQDKQDTDYVVESFKRVSAQYFAVRPDGRLIFLALKPSPSRINLLPAMRDTNERIAALCRADARCTFVDVFTPMLGADGLPRPELFLDDKLHMKPEGYRLWTRLVRPVLDRK
jgi:lysophospholipase L1-like esterase